jgi:NAD+ synthase
MFQTYLRQGVVISELKIDLDNTKKRLIDFLRAEFEKSGVENAVIGLSGGIDSALSAALTSEALGPERLHCVLMPYRTSSPESISDAMLLVDKLNCSHEIVDISPVVDAFIAHEPDMDRIRRGNIMARTRMITLYDRSAKNRALVVGTGNKTEILLGYTTLFGDSACAINPIGQLYKTQVWALARHLGVPEEMIIKAPSADLWQGQSDEEELGFTYKEVDRLFYYMVDIGKSDIELESLGFASDFIDSVRRRMMSQEFKRRMPTIAKLDS